MRRFRKEITEFVLSPSPEPAGFQSYRWRYPVRIDIAREYLCITPEEYELLFTRDFTPLHELYGFVAENIDGRHWTQIVSQVSELLARTALTYCEFIDLWRAEFVTFRLAHGRRERGEGEEREFPQCEPCYLEKIQIEFVDPADPAEALKRLAVFIRLWRKLRLVKGACYSF